MGFNGICALCLRQGELQESHLLPRALYKHLRDPRQRNQNPVLFSSQSSSQTQDQAKQHLLCVRCETRFNHQGERWTLANYCRAKDDFPLRELLRPHSAQQFTEDFSCYYCDRIPDVDTDSLAYFALSVIWRNSFCAWKIGATSIAQLILGPYQEPLRQYLAGESDLPEGIAIQASISSLLEPALITTFPRMRNQQGCTSSPFQESTS